MIGAKLLILCTSFPSLFLFYNLSLLALFIRNQSLSLLALLFVSYFTYWKFFAFNSHEEIQIQENKSRKFTSLHGEQINIYIYICIFRPDSPSGRKLIKWWRVVLTKRCKTMWSWILLDFLNVSLEYFLIRLLPQGVEWKKKTKSRTRQRVKVALGFFWWKRTVQESDRDRLQFFVWGLSFWLRCDSRLNWGDGQLNWKVTFACAEQAFPLFLFLLPMSLFWMFSGYAGRDWRRRGSVK